MPLEGRYGENKRRESRGYHWRGFGFLPRNPFVRNRDREQHGQGRHTYNLRTVASAATWFFACMFIVAMVNTDWTADQIPPNSPSLDIRPDIRHHEVFRTPWTLPVQRMKQFIPANDSSIHYVGRWVSSTVATETFSDVSNVMIPMYLGSYLDLCHNSTTISVDLSGYADTSTALLYATSLDKAKPIYQLIPNVYSGIMPLQVATGTEDISGWKTTRIIFPLANKLHDQGNIGLLGFHVDPYTQNLPVSADACLTGNEKPQSINGPHPRKLIEVITDSLVGNFGMSPNAGREIGAPSQSLAAVQLLLHWGWKIGEKFGADRRILGVDGMCLISNCPGLKQSKKNLEDLYFQSGPGESIYANIPWNFAVEKRPDVIVISLGNTDAVSLSTIQATPAIDLTLVTDDIIKRFENAYVNLVRSIRNAAYPVHFNPKSGLEYGSRDGTYSPVMEMQYVIPIYLLYPFNGGQLAASTQRVAARLARGEGEGYRGIAETKIYAVDTTSWMNMKEGDLEDWSFMPTQDIPLNRSQLNPLDTFRLTPIGHEKIAVYLQPRLCRYLATDPRTECADLGELDGGVTRGIPHEAVQMRGVSPERDRELREEARARGKKLRGKFVW